MIEKSELAPIVVFAFNRPEALYATLQSLKENPESNGSILYIFVDGPRKDNLEDYKKVSQVKNIAMSINGFKKINCIFSDHNKGLAKSIISGATEVLCKYGKAIVVEDDLYVSKSFLAYMNEMLNKFKDDKRIMQISGYSTKINIPSCYPYDVYLNIRAQSWSWATWYDRWENIDWEVKDYTILKTDKKRQKAFCKGGSDLYNMLKGFMEGRNNSWYIRFCYHMHKQHGFTVCPTKSLVRNDGFSKEATHCNVYNRYKISFEESHDGNFKLQKNLEHNANLQKEAIKYWTIRWRIIGKLLTVIQKIIKRPIC